ALCRLMRDPELRRDLGRRAAQSVRQRYALPAVLAQWDALFERVRGGA
ncbi:glycosyltransferase family 4 protein, partial [Bordetella pertussis]